MTKKQTKSAGGVVVNSLGQVLTVNQRNISWSLPKGHIEKGEAPIEAAKREIEEESGITRLKFIKELGTYQRYKISQNGGGDDTSEMKTIVMFLFKTEQNALQPKDVENPEARWIDKKQVAEILTHKKDKEFFLKIIKEIV